MFADVSKNIPPLKEEFYCIYSANMMEYLTIKAANKFLRESWREFKLRGPLKLVLPYLKHIVSDYLDNPDADLFLELYLVPPSLDSFRDKLKLLFIGYGHN